jgi:cytochrome P450
MTPIHVAWIAVNLPGASSLATAPDEAANELIGEAPASPAGPIPVEEQAALRPPPVVEIGPAAQILRFNQRQIQFVFGARRRLGETFRMRTAMPGGLIIVSHPDHVRSLFTASPELAPSLAAESPLAPIVGRSSVLTALEPRHMRQRKLLLPNFHGEAIERYTRSIAAAAEREIGSWPVGRPFPLAPRMQAITLDVIMAGIFGIEGTPRRDTPEYWLRFATKRLVAASTKPAAQISELMNLFRDEPVGLTRVGLEILDRPTYAVIARRRAAEDLAERRDILSQLLLARTEDGEGLSDREVRDELLTLVLAGHETTANSLAWAWERLVRAPDAHDRLRDAVRSGEGAAEQVEATILETMRSRPVVPIVGRRVMAPWLLSPYGVQADTPVLVSILLLHHREDVYPRPFEFLPERWTGRRPGTYEWIPFGGGTRRCLGAALAMAEQRVVLEAMARRLDLEAAEPEPERARHRNVTMIPAHGARVVVRSRLS